MATSTRWAPVVLVALGLGGAEVVARCALLLTPLADRMAYRLGPDATELAWWSHWTPGSDAGQRSAYAPRTGWRNQPGAHETSGVVETTDAAGHRITGPRGEGARVLLVGDSFTFGTDVGDQDTWAWGVQAREPTWAVVDAGVPSFGLEQTWLTLRASGPADVTVLGLDPLMVDRTVSRFAIYARPLIPAERQGCVLPEPVVAPEVLSRRITWRSKLLDLLAVLTWPLRDPGRPVAWERTRALLDCIRDDVSGTLVVAWFPVHVTVSHDASSPGREAIAAWCLDHPDVTCADATTALREVHRRDGTVQRRAHWTAAAHDAVSDVVHQAVARALDRRRDAEGPAGQVPL